MRTLFKSMAAVAAVLSLGISFSSHNAHAAGIDTAAGMTELPFSIQGTQLMVLNANGLGVGTVSPAARLDVNGSFRSTTGTIIGSLSAGSITSATSIFAMSGSVNANTLVASDHVNIGSAPGLFPVHAMTLDSLKNTTCGANQVLAKVSETSFTCINLVPGIQGNPGPQGPPGPAGGSAGWEVYGAGGVAVDPACEYRLGVDAYDARGPGLWYAVYAWGPTGSYPMGLLQERGSTYDPSAAPGVLASGMGSFAVTSMQRRC